jgi:hypothetical protein
MPHLITSRHDLRKATNWLPGPSDRRSRFGQFDTTQAKGRIKLNGNSTGNDCRLDAEAVCRRSAQPLDQPRREFAVVDRCWCKPDDPLAFALPVGLTHATMHFDGRAVALNGGQSAHQPDHLAEDGYVATDMPEHGTATEMSA